MLCPKCQFDNREGVNFCEECGAKLDLECPNCNAKIPPNRKFCGECGHKLTDSSEATALDFSKPQSYTPKFLADKILTLRSSIEGERKLVTVMFGDIANYTLMSERLDPEAVHQIMDGCFKILMDEIHKYEGTINQFTGDGVMAIFGAPVAHEDHAQRACYSALSIQKAMVKYGEEVKKNFGVDFRMRIGMNSGPVVVGSIGDDLRMDYTAVGDTTNLAARIQQAADTGEVWISLETRNIVRDYFHDVDLGEISLKDKGQSNQIYRVISERGGVRSRFEADLVRGVTELVGRRHEMEMLMGAFIKAKAGEAQIMDVIGEAGVGKSRLVYEFQNSLEKDVIFLSGKCVHYGRNINFLPVIQIVRAAFNLDEGITDEDAGKIIENKATNGLAQMISFYRSLLSLKVDDPMFNSLTPEGRKFGAFEAVKNLLFHLSEEKTLVVFLEDVHWIDKISKEYFLYFSRIFHKNPILMIAAYRPDVSLSWAPGAHYHRLGLETLSSKSSIKLMRNILRGNFLEPTLEQRLVERAGGNPFFVEEMVRELVDRGDLVKKDDEYVSNQPIERLEIPTTVQGVLAARMDRLSEDLKRTMQIASVIGRDFTLRLLENIMEHGDEIRSHLANLVELEIFCEKALFPELEYTFKHALTQEVAYESLLKQKRNEIHGRIAQTIEELYTEKLEEHYELIAYHYERSGNYQKTVDYLILAGEKSIKNGAAQTASEYFERVLKNTENQNIEISVDKKIRVHLGLAKSCLQIGAIGRCVNESRSAATLSRQHGLIDYERDSLFLLTMVIFMWPMKAETETSYKEGLARAREIGDKGLESSFLSSMGVRAAIDGEPFKGYLICSDAEKLAMESDDLIGQINIRLHRAHLERWIGRPRKTIELTEGLTDLERQTVGPNALSYIVSVRGLALRGLALSEVGRIEDGIKILKLGIDICEEFGIYLRLGRLYNSMGYSYSEIHQIKIALSFNHKAEGVARSLMKKYPMGRHQFAEIVAQSKVNLIENLVDQRNFEDAWTVLKDFEKETQSKDFNWLRYQWESRMNYLAAKILLQRNDIGQATLIIRDNLKKTSKNHMKKREGSFLRLLGEVQIRRNQLDNAIVSLNKAIHVLRKVGNPKLMWETYSALASACNKLGRVSEENESWGAAAKIITEVADSLSNRVLKSGFLKAKPIHEILLKAKN